MAAWDDAVRRRAEGSVVRLSTKQNFPPVTDTSETAWSKAVAHLTQNHEQLVKTVEAFTHSRLQQQVQGKSAAYYTFFYMFAGIVQHELYHAGQIALLKKAGRR
jgi:superoxide dismutase